MANEIRISSSITAIKEVDVTEGGNTYDLSAVDTNAGRSFGGSYDTLTAYTDDDIARWSSVVITATSADGLGDSGWTEASDVTDGAIPTTAYAVAVEYVSELGTVGNVKVTIGSQEMADLDAGEGIVLPLSGGVAIANVKIHADAYSNGVNEATVNVLVMGV
tara:strand:- start:1155 stop:1640 length:486 start_codon:yes stop_codon:yes gene_type:complete